MEQVQKSRSLPEQVSPAGLPPNAQQHTSKPNQVGTVILYGIPIVSLIIEAQERLCLAQISNTLLKQFSYNEIHNRRVALGITCVQCTPVQLEILRRAGAMPVSSRRCGMITRREAERLCKSFLGDNAPPRLPEDFAFSVHHDCAWGCRGSFLPSRYNSSRAKCIKCSMCGLFFSPNKFIFHSHRVSPSDKYVQPDAANFNSWRRHMKLSGSPSDEVVHAWEDVKAMFNGGTRKRLLHGAAPPPKPHKQPKAEPASGAGSAACEPSPAVNAGPALTALSAGPAPGPLVPAPRVPGFPDITLPISRMAMDFMYHHKPFAFAPYSTLPWLKRSPILFPHDAPFFSLDKSYQSAFKPVHPVVAPPAPPPPTLPDPEPEPDVDADADADVDADDTTHKQEPSDDEVDIETTDDKEDASPCARWSPKVEAIPGQPDIAASSGIPGETLAANPKPEFTSPGDRMWNITRLSFDRMDRSNLLYRHDFQRHFIIGRDEPALSRSPLPLTVKPVLDCTACQNHHPSLYPGQENNNKMPP